GFGCFMAMTCAQPDANIAMRTDSVSGRVAFIISLLLVVKNFRIVERGFGASNQKRDWQRRGAHPDTAPERPSPDRQVYRKPFIDVPIWRSALRYCCIRGQCQDAPNPGGRLSKFGRSRKARIAAEQRQKTAHGVSRGIHDGKWAGPGWGRKKKP